MDKGTKNLLGTLSPVYGMATGSGMFGKNVGVLPAAAKYLRDEREEDKMKEAMAAQSPAIKSPSVGMKKGGKVSSASKRADGIAQRGKTKGRML